MDVHISKGSENRLKRIMELKNYDEEKALSFAIGVAWLITEKRADKKSPKVKQT